MSDEYNDMTSYAMDEICSPPLSRSVRKSGRLSGLSGILAGRAPGLSRQLYFEQAPSKQSDLTFMLHLVTDKPNNSFLPSLLLCIEACTHNATKATTLGSTIFFIAAYIPSVLLLLSRMSGR